MVDLINQKNELCTNIFLVLISISSIILGGMLGHTLYTYKISQDTIVLFWNFLEKISQGFVSSPSPPNEV